jgi:hypothetical protein
LTGCVYQQLHIGQHSCSIRLCTNHCHIECGQLLWAVDAALHSINSNGKPSAEPSLKPSDLSLAVLISGLRWHVSSSESAMQGHGRKCLASRSGPQQANMPLSRSTKITHRVLLVKPTVLAPGEGPCKAATRRAKPLVEPMPLRTRQSGHSTGQFRLDASFATLVAVSVLHGRLSVLSSCVDLSSF